MMSFERSGSLRLRLSSCGCIAAASIALALAGCATQSSTTQHASGVGMLAKAVPVPSRSPSDDAREPWSPNYGPRPRIEDATPPRSPAPIEAGSTRIATMDADALIRHAVAQHEMRRP
jgi:hypothetical protein